MKKAYLAAPIFTPHQQEIVGRIKNLIESHGVEVFSPYHASQAIWDGRAPRDCSPQERAQVLRGNIENLDCDFVVAWVGGYDAGFVDPGVIWEMGYAAALSTAPAAWGRNGESAPFVCAYIDSTDTRQDMNLMLAGTVDAVVKGWVDLDQILVHLAQGDTRIAVQNYHPDQLIEHEKEPIV